MGVARQIMAYSLRPKNILKFQQFYIGTTDRGRALGFQDIPCFKNRHKTRTKLPNWKTI